MSWSALAWATDSDVGSSAAKFILILLANKADENYSCYPSIRTLMAESNAGRSTVLRALKDLETRGFISRRPQFHDSGARRSTRYYLNHPLAPHLSPSPDPAPPPSRSGTPRSRSETGPVPLRHGESVKAAPHGGLTVGPLESIN
jgi:Helix-turn-helix domain